MDDRKAGRANDQQVVGSQLRFRIALVTVATLAAIVLFVFLSGHVLPLAPSVGYGEHLLTTAFLLNIALILFGWMRSKELRNSLEREAEMERRTQEMALRDPVTGLWNRRELVRMIETISERKYPNATLLLLDLDHFKNVNDLYGHAAGDRLLRFVGGALKESVATDACCARLGGDEFAILLPGARAPELISDLAQSILDVLSAPITLDETRAHISCSIGIAALGPACGDAEALLRQADIAMYEAKRLGRNGFVWFDGAMERQLQERNRLEAEMREGIARGEFVPFYQPLICLESGDLIGFEVLARWQHPERGLLEPAEFIAVAEATHLISPLSTSVMRQAFLEAVGWPSDTTLAVNVSPVQFKDPLLAQRILQLLSETGFPARRLEIELTESSLLEDQAMALAAVESLKNSGISISLDDFGTGYASLTQLKALPFDRLKIDRSFVSALLEDEQSNAIVNTIANLGRSLRLPITAEGVESEGVKEHLQAIGCANAQGWLFGKAVPADSIKQMLAERGKADPEQSSQGSEKSVPKTGPDKRNAA